MLAFRSIEENVTKYRESKEWFQPRNQLQQEAGAVWTACKALAKPTEVKPYMESHDFLPTVRWNADLLLVHASKNHVRRQHREYRPFLAEFGQTAFKRSLFTHQNVSTIGWKRAGKVSRIKTKAKESILEKGLSKNVSLNLHRSFCRIKSRRNGCKHLNNWKHRKRYWTALRTRWTIQKVYSASTSKVDWEDLKKLTRDVLRMKAKKIWARVWPQVENLGD